MIPVTRELGVSIVAYSPLGRGLLTGQILSRNDVDEGDWRRTIPRFSEENLEKNLSRDFFEIANAKGVTPAQCMF